jgi:hypothetical protein
MASRRLFIAGATLILAFAVLLATHYWLLREEFNAGIAAKVHLTAVPPRVRPVSGDSKQAQSVLQSLRDLPDNRGRALWRAKAASAAVPKHSAQRHRRC